MWRVIGVIERMGQQLGVASVMLDTLVETINTEMSRVESTLDAEAAHLKATVAQLDLSTEAREDLTACVTRIEDAARHVARFAHRPDDAVAQIDALLAVPPRDPAAGD